MKTIDRFIDLLFLRGEEEFSRVLDAPEALRINEPCARAWGRAIAPYALSAGLWRSVGLLTPYALHARPSPATRDALRLPRVVRSRRRFPRTRAELEHFHAALLGLRRSALRSQSVNVGSTVISLPRHGAVPQFIDRLLAEQARPAKGNPIAKALVTTTALLLIHPFTDGNGRLARASLTLLGREATGKNHVPLAIPFVMQPSNKLLMAKDRAVAIHSLDPLTECFAKSALACAALTREIASQSSAYRDDCAALLADSPARVGRLLAGSVTLTDDLFRRCMKRVPAAHREYLETQMYMAVAEDEGVKWINAKCLRNIDQLLPLLFKLI